MSYELELLDGDGNKWNTNRIAIKNDRIDEVRNWLKALEIVFNDGRCFSFRFSLKPDCDDYSVFEASGASYEFLQGEGIYTEDDGLLMDDDEIFEECFAALDFENDDIKSNVGKIISMVTDAPGEYNNISQFLNAENLMFDIEKTKELTGNVPKCYIETFEDGKLDRELPQKYNN